ncbi:glycyl-radical enzyme activating protein [Photobacterium lipolyticum]|uniref:Glycyl-radical enzyme activating protein n=1 Tax=Photobacterium lipolyticum TaxID=266810 RepID=A0A2T3N2K9_9GAMM|nr:glycyl-radical enzyme activating protein [Photobacterium lipolyticum]PSW06571.1 glycyl-radical enzyme activating protein [Photobacterium lipolyticum]
MYFNIQRFSTHDGDGIRSILFLKGCSLACPWCQNPESRSKKRSLLFDQRSCLDECNLCQQACSAIQRDANGNIKINRSRLNDNDLIKLENTCPTQALSVCGKEAVADELCTILLKDKPYYIQSDGGVTFSGGEPLMQPELIATLAKRMYQEKINTAVETCLHVPWKNIERVLPHIDCWLTDLKHTDEAKFQRWTKGSLKRIKTNFEQLANKAKRIVIRVPVIPGFNDTEEDLRAIIDFAVSLESCKELHLLPYHTLGMNKYHLLDMPYLCSDKPLGKPELLESAKQYAQTHCNRKLLVTVRG